LPEGSAIQLSLSPSKTLFGPKPLRPSAIRLVHSSSAQAGTEPKMPPPFLSFLT
jgi:hypothetical protein